MSIANMIQEIRELLGLTIEDFVWQMNWNSCCYYQKIINGTKNLKTQQKQQLIPTWDKVVVNINNCVAKYDNRNQKQEEIYEIMNKYIYFGFEKLKI